MKVKLTRIKRGAESGSMRRTEIVGRLMGEVEIDRPVCVVGDHYSKKKRDAVMFRMVTTSKVIQKEVCFEDDTGMKIYFKTLNSSYVLEYVE